MRHFIIDKYRKKQFYIYIVLSTLFVYLFGLTMAQVSFDNKARELFYKDKNLYSYSLYNEYYMEDEYNKMKQTVEQTEGMYYDYGVNIDGSLCQSINDYFVLVSRHFYNLLNLKLQEGIGFSDNTDEVIVVKNQHGYQLGDMIEAVAYDDNGAYTTRELKVVGIMEYPIFVENIGLISCGSVEDGGETSSFWKYYTSFHGENQKNIFLLHPECDLNYGRIPDEMCYVYVEKENEKTLSILNELKKYGNLERIADINQYERDFMDREEAILEICMLLAYLCGVIIYNYLDMRRKKQEYGLYFMMGATKLQTMLIATLNNLSAFGVGMLLGTCLVYKTIDLGFIERILFLWSNQWIIFAGMCIFYLLSVLPVLYSMYRTNPISLIKGNE